MGLLAMPNNLTSCGFKQARKFRVKVGAHSGGACWLGVDHVLDADGCIG
jgi:hypothetical protein